MGVMEVGGKGEKGRGDRERREKRKSHWNSHQPMETFPQLVMSQHHLTRLPVKVSQKSTQARLAPPSRLRGIYTADKFFKIGERGNICTMADRELLQRAKNNTYFLLDCDQRAQYTKNCSF